MLDSILFWNEKTDGQLDDQTQSIQSKWFHMLMESKCKSKSKDFRV